MLAIYSIEELKNQIRRMEDDAFAVAVGCAYFSTVEVNIPKYTMTTYKRNENGELVEETVEIEGKPKKTERLSYSKMVTQVSRSKSTISAWVNAVKKIIDEGLFDGFVNGEYHFNADKLNIILDPNNEEVFENDEFSYLLDLSINTLEKRVKDYKPTKEDEGEESEGEENTEDENEGENAEGENTTEPSAVGVLPKEIVLVRGENVLRITNEEDIKTILPILDRAEVIKEEA